MSTQSFFSSSNFIPTPAIFVPQAVPQSAADFSLIPEELKTLNNWLLWKRETRDGRSTKVPYQTNGYKASSTNSATWTTFENAVREFEACPSIYSGIGCAITGGLTGIDFDHCCDRETGEVNAYAKAAIRELNSYTELSPSGTGYHVWVRGTLPQGVKTSQIEIYPGGRYFTMSGEHVGGTPTTINECDLPAFCEKFAPSAKEKKGPGPASTNFQRLSDAVAGRNGGNRWAPFERRIGFLLAEPGLNQNCPFHSTHSSILNFGIKKTDQRLIICNGATGAGRHCWDLVASIYNWDNEIDIAGGKLPRYKNMFDAARALCEEEGLNFYDFFPKSKGAYRGGGNEDDGGDGLVLESPMNHTEAGNGRRLLAAFGKNIKHCIDDNEWRIFDGKIWAIDRTSKRVHALMKRVLIEMQRESAATVDQFPSLAGKITKQGTVRVSANLTDAEEKSLPLYVAAKKALDWAKASESSNNVRGSVEMASSEAGVAIGTKDFDTNRFACNVQNGTIEFHNQQIVFREHSREDLCTRMMPIDYVPGEDCPEFTKFINWMFPDEKVARFVQTYLGLCLTGEVVRAILIFYGEGANGKSALIKIVSNMLGMGREGYGISVGFSTFAVGREESASGHRADLIPLDGPRFITAAESNKGTTKLDMARLKELTGGDQTNARGAYAKEAVTFYNQGKIILQTNNLPTISDDSEGAWERLKLVKCNSRIEKARQDENLATAIFNTEGSGILNWLIEGASVYFERKRDGLGGFDEPDSVARDTQNFRGSENHMARFVEEECIILAGGETQSAALYKHYKNWCDVSGEKPESHKMLTQFLARRYKVQPDRRRQGTVLEGIELRNPPSPATTEPV